MNADIFVQSHYFGEFHRFPQHVIRKAFGACLEETEPDFWQVKYDDEAGSEVSIRFEPQSDCVFARFTIEGGQNDPRLWESLAEVIRSENLVMYFAGCRGPIIGVHEAAKHIPPGMIAAMGEPLCVESGREILSEVVGRDVEEFERA